MHEMRTILNNNHSIIENVIFLYKLSIFTETDLINARVNLHKNYLKSNSILEGIKNDDPNAISKI